MTKKSRQTHLFLNQHGLESNEYVVTHFSGSGFNNQLHQVLNAVSISKALNRTFCLSPFLRRKSDETGGKSVTTHFEEIFEKSILGKVVNIETMHTCSSLCAGKLDFIVNMSPNKISKQAYDR